MLETDWANLYFGGLLYIPNLQNNKPQIMEVKLHISGQHSCPKTQYQHPKWYARNGRKKGRLNHHKIGLITELDGLTWFHSVSTQHKKRWNLKTISV